MCDFEKPICLNELREIREAFKTLHETGIFPKEVSPEIRKYADKLQTSPASACVENHFLELIIEAYEQKFIMGKFFPDEIKEEIKIPRWRITPSDKQPVQTGFIEPCEEGTLVLYEDYLAKLQDLCIKVWPMGFHICPRSITKKPVIRPWPAVLCSNCLPDEGEDFNVEDVLNESLKDKLGD